MSRFFNEKFDNNGAAGEGGSSIERSGAQSDVDGPLAVILSAYAAAKRYRKGLFLWVALCTAISIFYANSATPVYTATATLLLDPRRQISGQGLDVLGASLLDNARAESELQVLKSERLLSKVFNGLNLAENPELLPQTAGIFTNVTRNLKLLLQGQRSQPELSTEQMSEIAFANFSDRVNVKRIGKSYVVDISYSSRDPSLSRRVANATASAYLWQSVVSKADSASNGAEFIQGRVNALASQVKAAAAGVENGQLPTSATPDADARVIGAALQPLAPSAPRKGLIVLLGVTLGAMSGVFFLAVSSAINNTVYRRETIVRDTGLPCLSALPDLGRRSSKYWSIHSRVQEGKSLLEDKRINSSMRELQVSLSFLFENLKVSRNPVIAFAAWSPDVGCTTVCYALAKTALRAGLDAVVIDADFTGSFNRPTSELHESVDGFSDLLSFGPSNGDIKLLNRHGLLFLPAHGSRSEGHEMPIFNTKSAMEIVEKARSKGSVFIDLPPFSATGDAKVIAKCADVVLIVAAAGRTTTEEIGSLTKSLQDIGVVVAGVVLNRVRV